jgi:hypothetical protein
MKKSIRPPFATTQPNRITASAASKKSTTASTATKKTLGATSGTNYASDGMFGANSFG